MADHEIRLVSKIIRDGVITPVLDRGVTADWFVNTEARSMFAFCVENFERYGKPPVPASVRDVMPGATILNVNESLDYLIDAFVAWRRRGLVDQAVQDAIAHLDDDDHEGALQLLASRTMQIEDVGNEIPDIDLTKNVQRRIDGYKALVGLPDGMRGLPTGFPTIDKATLGLQGGQLVAIVATPKAGKSTLLLRIARHIWMQGKRVLFISFEMTNPEQEARHDSMAARVAHKKLLNGDLAPYELQRLEKDLMEMEGSDNPFILKANHSGDATLSYVAAAIDKYKPDVVFVDGVYLMLDSETKEHGSREALTNLTRGFKRMAMRKNLPVCISTQVLTWKLNASKKITGDSIGYSSSFYQDSDVILGLEFPGGDEDITDERILRIVDARACPPGEVPLIWDWDNGVFEEAAHDDAP